MPRRRNSRGMRQRPKWAWDGSYLGVAQTPADVLVNIFVLYDPRAAKGDKEASVTVYRTMGNVSCYNVSTAGSVMFGFGIYIVEQNDAGAITTSTDPLGITAEEIEASNVLFHRMDFIQAKVAGEPLELVRYEFDTTVKRKLKGRQMLVAMARVSSSRHQRPSTVGLTGR